MMSKTQVKNQESNKFQELKSRSIKNQDSSEVLREDSRYARTIKISIKRFFQKKILNSTICPKQFFK